MAEVSSQRNDEIDLIELFRVLWKKKVWIVLSAFVCTLVAGVYAFTAKEQWTSTAIIVAPRTTDLGTLLPARAEYARIIGDGDFSAGKLSDSLYGQFKHFLLSNDLKRQFLEQSEWVKNYTKEMTEEQKRKYIEETVSKYLIIHEVDPKKKDLTELDKISLKIIFSAETPKDAQSVLTEYVSFVNQYILNQTNQEFKLGFNLRLDELKFTKEQIEENLTEAKKVQVENLTNALEIAKKAGITDFSRGNNNISDSKLADGTYLFMLGEKYLQTQLDIAKNNHVVYPTNYYSTERQLSKLTKLAPQLDLVENVKAYYYLSSPDYPVVKDNPKRVLILLAGFILGFILSSTFIVLGNLFTKAK
ncbi:chain-length determining protein [Haemophilus parahaemolyticus]|uniref:Chain-length determining protein n=2 Tax=Haemophilus parahaemolyticus TaxID=735 RepID=A0AAE6MPC4_HAEPH|nr:LPS O-antigen chain length determinant protein WzzB [Haemophilus parahaemolyticus]EIJ71308.1 chain length determinant protein [Haemophilus parahaemolyticus HK385]OOR96706.1 chain-length determining protein [Haemophilus parahaemolyticus]QEN10848.1 chain-length determining protein [Haemophilus parahaemolyticus]QRP12037.1 LPS O-antigen chain length determinant protein WzzB [Haemophilus parahaemolyticus]STO67200.1 Lipopolysaccharide biosynthesis protein wzzE [Haemophilus parahaemolyticus HK385]